MSEENFEIVRAAIDASNRDDWDAALRYAAPNFEWDNSRAMSSERGVYRLDQVRQFWADTREPWESVRIEIDELIESGDHVVVPHTTHARGRDGIEVTARSFWLFTIRNGKIERVCLYQDRAEALEAAGHEE